MARWNSQPRLNSEHHHTSGVNNARINGDGTKSWAMYLWVTYATFIHLYVVTFQQHLHMEYISFSWNDIAELVVSGTYPWSFVTQIFHNSQPNFRSIDFHLTKRNPWFSSFLVSSNPLSRKSMPRPFHLLQTVAGLRYRVYGFMTHSPWTKYNLNFTKKF
jgi:hypothetical protein